METLTEMFAFWFVPAPREQEFFTSCVAELAARFGGPVFEPHLTLLGCIPDRARALRALDDIAAASSYELEFEGVFSAKKFTQTLFVRFHPSDQLLELRRALAQAARIEIDDNFDPHLSLLYKEMDSTEKAALAADIEIPFSSVSFVELKLIAHPPEITTRADVDAWSVFARRDLAGA